MPLFQGFATHAAGAELLPYKYDPGDIKPNEVEIAISHCGVCRSDIHMVDNDWGISHYPLIPGHEIVGKVISTGSAVLGLQFRRSGRCGLASQFLRPLRVVSPGRREFMCGRPGHLCSPQWRLC